MRNEYLDSAPLDTWLMIINKGVNSEGVMSHEKMRSTLVKLFVHGMGVRGLIHHWEDCPIECLAGKVTEAQGILIGQIEEKLMCEEMFTIAMEIVDTDAYQHLQASMSKPVDLSLIGDISGTISPEIAQQFMEKVDKMMHKPQKCSCDIRDLCTQGCKCGGV